VGKNPEESPILRGSDFLLTIITIITIKMTFGNAYFSAKKRCIFFK